MSLFETRDSMFRTMNIWERKTFGEAMADIVITDDNKESVDLLKIVVDKQKLVDKPMNGFCSEKLLTTEIERLGPPYVTYFDAVNEREAFWTPLDYIYELCKSNVSKRAYFEKKAKKHNMSFERLTWCMCARALRALPSFIREHQLLNALRTNIPKGQFSKSQELDMSKHCDILMTLNDKEYYMWSFVSSARGIANFADKFKNNRYGHILNGNHLICPFDKDSTHQATLYRGWCLYSPQYIDEIKAAIYQREPLDYSVVLSDSIYKAEFYRRPIVINKSIA